MRRRHRSTSRATRREGGGGLQGFIGAPGLCRKDFQLSQHVGSELRQVGTPVSGRVGPLQLHVGAAAAERPTADGGRSRQAGGEAEGIVVRGLLEGRAGTGRRIYHSKQQSQTTDSYVLMW